MCDTEIQELYAASYRRLLGQLIGVTGSVVEAEDVVQEAFVRGLDHPRRLLGGDDVRRRSMLARRVRRREELST